MFIVNLMGIARVALESRPSHSSASSLVERIGFDFHKRKPQVNGVVTPPIETMIEFTSLLLAKD